MRAIDREELSIMAHCVICRVSGGRCALKADIIRPLNDPFNETLSLRRM
jgi:hypothetical protein